MVRGLNTFARTVELQCSVPHGPARGAKECERQDGDSRGVLQHSRSQTGAPHQGLQDVNRTHLNTESGEQSLFITKTNTGI